MYKLIKIYPVVFRLKYVDWKGDVTSPLYICPLLCFNNARPAGHQADFQLNKIHKIHKNFVTMAKCFESTNDRHTYTHTHTNFMSSRMEYWSKYLRSSFLGNFITFIAHIFSVLEKSDHYWFPALIFSCFCFTCFYRD
jgi:hypothetical protein